MYKITIRKDFSSAHKLREYKGKCESLHGHNWKIEVTVKGNNLNKTGLLMDFGDLKIIVNDIIDKLDHKYLNETEPFDKINPTSENIAKFIFDEVDKNLKGNNCKIDNVKVWESDNSFATYCN